MTKSVQPYVVLIIGDLSNNFVSTDAGISKTQWLRPHSGFLHVEIVQRPIRDNDDGTLGAKPLVTGFRDKNW